MKNLRRFASVTALFAFAFAGFSQPLAASPDSAAIGREVISELVQGRWSAVEARFDQRMKDGLPEEKLADAWQQVTAQAGAFEHVTRIKVIEKDNYHVAVVSCAFAHADLDVRIAVDAAGRIAGLFFVPAAEMSSPSTGKHDYAALGREIVSALARAQFASVELHFDDRMKAALPENKLATTWQQIIAQAGPFDHIIGVQLSQESGYQVALVSCAFAHASLDAKVVLDSSGHIAGFFFVPAVAGK
jgi:predicted ArsR family transcriptional regulator